MQTFVPPFLLVVLTQRLYPAGKGDMERQVRRQSGGKGLLKAMNHKGRRSTADCQIMRTAIENEVWLRVEL